MPKAHAWAASAWPASRRNWTGFSLPDSPAFDEWHFFASEDLRRAYACALQRLVELHTRCNELDQAIDYAHRLLATDPLHEPAQRQLIALYAGNGQRAAALRQYRECVRLLAAELNLPPLDETVQLYEAVRANRLLPLAGCPPLATVSTLAPQPERCPADLSHPARQLLTAVAVIGPSVPYEMLRAVSGRSEEELVDSLDELLARGILWERMEGTSLCYSFLQEGLRALVYEQASLARRQLLQRRVAQALTSSHSPRPLSI